MTADIRTCLALLPIGKRWQWAALIPVAIAAAVVETFGAAAVFALIAIIGEPSRAATLPIASLIYARIPWQGDSAVVLVFTACVMALYIVRNLVLAGATWAQEKVMVNSVAEVSGRMLLGYLAAPYAAHVQRDSASIIQRITDSVDVAFRFVLASTINIASELFVIAGVVAVMALTAPMVTLATAVATVALLLVPLALTRHAFTHWGADRQRLEEELLRSVQQSIGAFKEARIAGRERFFYDAFAVRQRAVMRIRWLSAIVSTLLRLGAETVFVFGLLATVLVALRGTSGAGIVPLLGLFAYAGFRIIPSTNRIMLNANNMRFGRASVRLLHRDRDLLQREASIGIQTPETEAIRLSFTEAIRFEHVSYAYDARQESALQDVDLVIQKGESVGIVGPTGAGKSTLVDLLLGLLEPRGGRVLVDGVDIQPNLRGWQRRIGYVPQVPYLLDDTLRRNITFGLADRDIDEPRVAASVRLAQLDEFVRSLPDGLDTMVGERGARLSGGERQRVAIARALYLEPDVLVFDEATSALDNRTELAITRALESLKGTRTILIIAHRLSTLQGCDRLIFVQGGRVTDTGAFGELVARNADFRALVQAGRLPEVVGVTTETR